MNSTTTAPIVEKVNVRHASINLQADMLLASVPVTVYGHYFIHSNIYEPTSVMINTDALNSWERGAVEELEFFSNAMGWDYDEVHQAIQEAVEKRDQ